MFWVIANVLFRVCIYVFEKFGVVPKSSHQVFLGSLLKKENFNEEVIQSFAKTLSVYFEICRGT